MQPFCFRSSAAFLVVAPAAATAFGLGRRRSLSSAALTLVMVFGLASAAGLGILRKGNKKLLHFVTVQELGNSILELMLL